MTKKIFITSSVLLALVVGAIFVYNYAFKKPSVKDELDIKKSTKTEEGKLGEIPSEDIEEKNLPITAISDEPVFGATLSPDGKFIYYFLKNNGQLNKVGFDGRLEKVLAENPSLVNLKEAVWNKQKNKVIAKTEISTDKLKYYHYDLTAKSFTPLKDNIDSVAWSSLGDKIIYKYYDSKTKKRAISVSDSNGKNWRDLTNFDHFGVNISPIPGSSLISFWPAPNAFTPTSVNTINFSGEDKKEILKDRYGVDILWSPNGKWAAVSYTDQKGGHKTDLAIMNPRGGQFQTLFIPTFISKCVWSFDSQYLYCALPVDIPATATLPNDWQEGKILTTDTFWKIDTATGEKERMVETEKINGNFDVIKPFLSQDGKTLFFVNKKDGKLYKLELE